MAQGSWKKVGLNWKQASNVWMKVSGTWKSGVIPWMKISGVWKQCFIMPTIVPSAYSINIDWPFRSTGSIAVNVSPDSMTTTSTPSGSFFVITSGASATGDFTLAISAKIENDATPNDGTITISDNSGIVADVVIAIHQAAKPI